MLGGVISLASYGFSSGGAVGNLLYTLQNNGVFAYVLPFVFIFAVLFVILQNIPIFGGSDKKGINAILAIVIALMSLQLNFVSYFFQELFPRMGVVLGILIVAMILVGLFFNYSEDESTAKKTFGVIITLALIVIVVQALTDSFGWSGLGSGWGVSYWLRMYGWTIFGVILFVAAIVGVIMSGGKADDKKKGKDKKKD